MITHLRWAAVLAIAPLLLPVPVGAQGVYTSMNTAQFAIQYERSIPEEDVRVVADFLQKDYTVIAAQLGFEPSRKTEVRTYASVGKFMAETKFSKPWRVAMFSRGILHTQPPQALIQRQLLETSLSYELALVFLAQPGERGCPRWLRECYAVHHSGILPDLTPSVGAKLASFSDLNQDLQVHENPPQREDVQYVLGHTLEFFFERFGEGKTYGLYKEFDGTKSVETVFRKYLGEEYSSVEKAWAGYINARTSRVR